jgi:hypothetical protein
MTISRLQIIEWKALLVCMSSTANSMASRSILRRIHFCIAETQAIDGRPLRVAGIIGLLRLKKVR